MLHEALGTTTTTTIIMDRKYSDSDCLTSETKQESSIWVLHSGITLRLDGVRKGPSFEGPLGMWVSYYCVLNDYVQSVFGRSSSIVLYMYEYCWKDYHCN
jgi:hypothetical protein